MRLHPGSIENLVARATGAGSATTPPFHLPRARYTVFVEYDRPESVSSFTLVHARAGPVSSENAVGAPHNGDVSAPLVQQELQAGTYVIEIGTMSELCSWDVQVVLNTMPSWRPPPPQWRRALPPPPLITRRRGDDPGFVLSEAGYYDAEWAVGRARPDRVPPPHSIELRAADGRVVHLGSSDGRRANRTTGFHFLGAGHWTLVIKGEPEWEFVLAPVIGATGGGARAF